MTESEMQSQPVRRPLDEQGTYFVHVKPDAAFSDEMHVALDKLSDTVEDLKTLAASAHGS